MKGDAILLLLTMALGSGLAKAQVPTTMGKEFMVSFMNNGFRGCHSGNDAYDNLTLLVSAKNACSGTVTNPITGWTTAFDVGAYNITTIDIPQSVAYNSQADGIANTGLKVVSSDTISLYVANEFENSYDAANVLPIPTLGCQYMIQTFGTGTIANTCSENVRSSFMIIGTEANTTVEITPTTDTYGGHPAGTAYSITLNEGQCYHVMAASAGTDFSGTTINALDDKKIVVFNGNTITTVPINMSKGYDHVFEEAMPVDYWGTKFVVTTTKSTDAVPIESDYIRITALEDGTTVFKSGATLATLNSGESHQFVMQCASEAACYLESDKPVAVYLYQCSHQSDYEVYGDPSMVWISPVEQTMYDVTFSTLQVQQVETHYVNIVCYTDNLSSVTLDGGSLSLQFAPVPGNSLYSFAKVPLRHSAHVLRSGYGFVAHVYGIGQAEGYAYSVGSSAKMLTKQMYINDVMASSLPNGFIACQSDELHFRTEVNYDYTRMEWNFGDSGTGTGAAVNHAYPQTGDYQVLSVVYKMVEGVETPSDSLTAMVHVKPVVSTTVDTTFCGDSFEWNGITYDTPGTYVDTLSSVYGCDSIVTLNLGAGDVNVHDVWHSACESYEWYGSTYTQSGNYEHLENYQDVCDTLFILHLNIGHNGTSELNAQTCDDYTWFGTVYNEAGDYEHHVTTPEGCDSTYVLHLTIVPNITVDEYLISCDQYQWYEHLCDFTQDYSHLSLGPNGCDTVHTLHFTRSNDVLMDFYVDTCDSYRWQGFLFTESGTYPYDISIPGTNGCDSLLTLHLTISQTPQFKVKGLTQISVATSFWPGTYNYHAEGNYNTEVEWTLDGPEDWIITPFDTLNSWCMVNATSIGTATLYATTGSELCSATEAIFLNATYFGTDENVAPQVAIYPNPAKDKLIIVSDNIQGIRVFNLFGQVVSELSIPCQNEVSLPLDNYGSDIYFIEIRTLTGKTVKRFAVTK